MPTARPEELVRGYEALRTTAAWHVLDRDVVAVTGADAPDYLQGQCSQDVIALAEGESADALLLSPQGKIDAFVRVTRSGDHGYVIDTDGGFGPAVVARLERFRLRVKVDIEPLDWWCLAVRGPKAAEVVVGQPAIVAPVAWSGAGGVDLLGPGPGPGVAGWVDDAVEDCGEGAYEAWRIECGIPVNGREVTEGTIAAEVGLVDRTVSFTKGCFTGQELVARLDARGSKVARRLCGVVLEDGTGRWERPGSEVELVGATVSTADGEHEAGRLSSVAWSPRYGRPVALATLHRRVEPPERVGVSWEGAGSDRTEAWAEARPLPLGG